MRFKDKVVLVTGSSRGVGRAVALGFAADGAKVIVNYVSSENVANELVNDINEAGGDAVAIKCDVGQETEVKAMIDQVVNKYGQLDVLVNNAAIVFDVPMFEKTVDQWNKTLSANLIGAFLCAKYAVPHLKETKGKIVNICSTSGFSSFAPTSADYDASKVGLMSLTKNLAKELSPDIRVNGIAPGWVDTDMNKDLPQDLVDEEMAKISLHRMAKPEEIANIALFLASDDASYLNGSIIMADGGTL